MLFIAITFQKTAFICSDKNNFKNDIPINIGYSNLIANRSSSSK